MKTDMERRLNLAVETEVAMTRKENEGLIRKVQDMAF